MPPTGIDFVNAVANLGGVAILGYWLIWGLPATLKQIEDSHEKEIARLVDGWAAERASYGEQLKRMGAALDRFTDLLSSLNIPHGGEPGRKVNRPPG